MFWGVRYSDGRWIGVWLTLPGVRCRAGGRGWEVSGIGVGASALGGEVGGFRLNSNPSLKSVLC